MATKAPLPTIPPAVAAVYDTYPAPARKCLLTLRQLIFETAASLPAAGPLTETLKWGEPAYLTEATKSGTTIRLGWSAKHPKATSLFVSCQTSLIEGWRAQYDGELTFIGNREIRFALGEPLPAAPVRHCIALALTYHSRKSAP